MSEIADTSENVETEDDWNPFDQVVLKCYDITRDTMDFLSRNGYKSLMQLKSVPLSDLDDVLINPPLLARQIQRFLNLIELYRDPGSFTAFANDVAMTEPHLKALEDNLHRLKSMIKIEKLLVRLQSYGVLKDNDLKEIHAEKSGSEKVLKLGQLVPMNPDVHFLFFLQALRDIGQGYVSAMVEKTLCNEQIPGKYMYIILYCMLYNTYLGSPNRNVLKIKALVDLFIKEHNKNIITSHSLTVFDCGIEIKFTLEEIEKDGKLTPEYLAEFRRFLMFKESLQSKLNGCDQKEKESLLKKLSIVESFQRRIVAIFCGSIFIALTCPDEEAMEDLRLIMTSGVLKRVVMEAFEIEELQKQFEITSLGVFVNLTEIRKLPTKSGYLYQIINY